MNEIVEEISFQVQFCEWRHVNARTLHSRNPLPGFPRLDLRAPSPFSLSCLSDSHSQAAMQQASPALTFNQRNLPKLLDQSVINPDLYSCAYIYFLESVRAIHNVFMQVVFQ